MKQCSCVCVKLHPCTVVQYIQIVTLVSTDPRLWLLVNTGNTTLTQLKQKQYMGCFIKTYEEQEEGILNLCIWAGVQLS